VISNESVIAIHTFCPDFPRCYASWKRQFREADGNENLKDAQHLAEVMFVCVCVCGRQLVSFKCWLQALATSNLRENRTDLHARHCLHPLVHE